MSLNKFTKSDRHVIYTLTGLMVILTIIYAVDHRNTFSEFHPQDSNPKERDTHLSDSFATLRLQREEAKRRRELRYLELKDSFARLKNERERRKIEREARYLAIKDSFAQLKIERERRKAERDSIWAHRQDSIQQIRPKKLSEGEYVNVNQADTLSLMKIPGIGKGLATAILSYRERLGGFYAKSQLLEIYGIPNDIEKYIIVDGSVRKIDINKLSVTQLRKHPYLNFYQAKSIWEYRQKYGKIKNIKQLSLRPEFTEEDMNRLQPYLAY